MLKRERRNKYSEKYKNIETPKWEAEREDEQWNPNPWKIVVMLILIFLGLYFLMDSFL